MVLERVGEVVYRLQMLPKDRKVALRRDRLSPYRGNLTISFQKRKSNPLASQNNMDIDPMPVPHTAVVKGPLSHTQPLPLDFPLCPLCFLSLLHFLLRAQIPGTRLGTLFSPLWMSFLFVDGH